MNDFLTNFYEFWGTASQGTFSQEMYDLNLYFLIGIWMILISIGIMAIFYFITRPPYNKRWCWSVCVGIAMLFNAVIGYSYSHNSISYHYEVLQEQADEDAKRAAEIAIETGEPQESPAMITMPYTTEFAVFTFYNVFWSFMVCFLSSLLFKNFSSQARRIPF